MTTTRIKHLYIHVPFCKTICSYCDFCHRVYDKEICDKYLNRLKEELIESESYETIYVGGGTPTSLSDVQLEKLLTMIKPHALNVKEYTIEVNPENLTLSKIKLFNKYGINRISMGLQSSNDDELRLMNRHHSFNDVKDKVELLKSNGISNISIDIMYSLPTQTMATLRKTIDDVISLNVPHLSIYSLTIEPNTLFGKRNFESLDEDIEADMYEYIVKTLKENGYDQYEVSNFCKRGYESKHNIGYWKYEDFRGIGPGASGKINNERYDNTKDIKKYISSKDVIDTIIPLTKKDIIFENLMMSLRMKEGINIDKFANKYSIDFKEYFKKGIYNKNVEINDGFLRVKNLEILNNTLLDFME